MFMHSERTVHSVMIQVVSRDLTFICFRYGMVDITELAKPHHYATIEDGLKTRMVHAGGHRHLFGSNMEVLHTLL